MKITHAKVIKAKDDADNNAERRGVTSRREETFSILAPKIFLWQHPPFPHASPWQIASVSLVRHAISSFTAVKDTLTRIQVICADIRAVSRANHHLLGVLNLTTRIDFLLKYTFEKKVYLSCGNNKSFWKVLRKYSELFRIIRDRCPEILERIMKNMLKEQIILGTYSSTQILNSLVIYHDCNTYQ